MRHSPKPSRLPAFLFLFLFSCLTAGCQRGCARQWLEEHGTGEAPTTGKGSLPLNAVDCPDGLARCSGGIVEASRLARIPQPCRGRPEACACPWERVGDCGRPGFLERCVVDDLELVVPRDRAERQLCAPAVDAGPLTRTPSSGQVAPGCEEGQAYRCAGGVVVACHDNAVVGACVRGCFEEGAAIDDDEGGERVQREAAFAILCSR